jgi:hypothetical protein
MSTIIRAHAEDYFAQRFAPHTFRVRSTRASREGTWIDQEPPEELVPDILPSCSYCGSLTIDDFLQGLETSGAHFSGSDWKYGWPHKFYLDLPCAPYRTSLGGRYYTENGKRIAECTWGERAVRHHKFYSIHLLDATPEQLERWQRIAQPRLGITFELVDGKLKYRAPHGGFQTWGDIP